MIEVTEEMRCIVHKLDTLSGEYVDNVDYVIRSIIELHEQSKPKPEPVAWMVWNVCQPINAFLSEEQAIAYAQNKQRHSDLSGDFNSYRVAPLYTTPPTREPFSEEFLMALAEECTAQFFNGVHQNATIHFARAVEQAHGIGTSHEPA